MMITDYFIADVIRLALFSLSVSLSQKQKSYSLVRPLSGVTPLVRGKRLLLLKHLPAKPVEKVRKMTKKSTTVLNRFQVVTKLLKRK